MTLRQYLVVMSVAVALAWSGWLVVLVLMNPFEAGWFAFFLFYTSLAIALMGSFALLGIAARVLVSRSSAIHAPDVLQSFRQGLILTALVVISLLLQSRSLLTWWNGALLLVAFFLLELCILLMRPRRPPPLPSDDAS